MGSKGPKCPPPGRPKKTVIDKLQKMQWLKAESKPENEKSHRGEITLESLSRKKEEEDYFPGTRNEKKKKKDKKRKTIPQIKDIEELGSNAKTDTGTVVDSTKENSQASANMQPSFPRTGKTTLSLAPQVSETRLWSVWNTETSVADKLFPNVESTVIQRYDEEEMMSKALAESIANAQLERFRLPTPEIPEKEWETHEDDDDGWDNIKRNLPTPPKMNEPEIDGFPARNSKHDDNNNSPKQGILNNRRRRKDFPMNPGSRPDFSFKNRSQSVDTDNEKSRKISLTKSVSFSGSSPVEYEFDESSECYKKSGESSEESEPTDRQPCSSGNGSKSGIVISTPSGSKFIDKYGRIDGYSERHLFLGKGARRKEEEYIARHCSLGAQDVRYKGPEERDDAKGATDGSSREIKIDKVDKYQKDQTNSMRQSYNAINVIKKGDQDEQNLSESVSNSQDGELSTEDVQCRQTDEEKVGDDQRNAGTSDSQTSEMERSEIEPQVAQDPKKKVKTTTKVTEDAASAENHEIRSQLGNSPIPENLHSEDNNADLESHSMGLSSIPVKPPEGTPLGTPASISQLTNSVKIVENDAYSILKQRPASTDEMTRGDESYAEQESEIRVDGSGNASWNIDAPVFEMPVEMPVCIESIPVSRPPMTPEVMMFLQHFENGNFYGTTASESSSSDPAPTRGYEPCPNLHLPNIPCPNPKCTVQIMTPEETGGENLASQKIICPNFHIPEVACPNPRCDVQKATSQAINSRDYPVRNSVVCQNLHLPDFPCPNPTCTIGNSTGHTMIPECSRVGFDTQGLGMIDMSGPSISQYENLNSRNIQPVYEFVTSQSSQADYLNTLEKDNVAYPVRNVTNEKLMQSSLSFDQMQQLLAQFIQCQSQGILPDLHQELFNYFRTKKPPSSNGHVGGLSPVKQPDAFPDQRNAYNNGNTVLANYENVSQSRDHTTSGIVNDSQTAQRMMNIQSEQQAINNERRMNRNTEYNRVRADNFHLPSFNTKHSNVKTTTNVPPQSCTGRQSVMDGQNNLIKGAIQQNSGNDQQNSTAIMFGEMNDSQRTLHSVAPSVRHNFGGNTVSSHIPYPENNRNDDKDQENFVQNLAMNMTQGQPTNDMNANLFLPQQGDHGYHPILLIHPTEALINDQSYPNLNCADHQNPNPIQNQKLLANPMNPSLSMTNPVGLTYPNLGSPDPVPDETKQFPNNPHLNPVNMASVPNENLAYTQIIPPSMDPLMANPYDLSSYNFPQNFPCHYIQNTPPPYPGMYDARPVPGVQNMPNQRPEMSQPPRERLIGRGRGRLMMKDLFM